MTRHSLGLLQPNGIPGLAPSPGETAFLARAKQAASAPIPGAAGDADVDELIRRVGNGVTVPARRSRVPQFKDNPIGAIGFLLQQAGAGLQGKETPLQRIKKEEAAQQVLELKRFQVGLDALGEFTKLPANQRAAAAAGFNKKFGDFLGLDFAELAPTVDLDDVLALAKGIDPEILAPLSGDIESLQKTLLDQSKRGVLEEISDSRNLRPAMRKVMGAVDLLGKRLGPEDRAALAERRFTFADVADLAGPLGLTKPELAALERNQARVFPQLSETTGLNFVSAEVLEQEAGRPSLQRIESEEEAKARGKAKFREPKGKAVNILLPDGKRASGRELPSGELKIVGEGGALVSAPPGSLKMTLQAAPGELPDAALNRKVTQTKATMGNFVRMASETITFLRNPKTVLGGAGSTIRFAQSLKAQAGQLARAFSGDHFDGATSGDLTVAQMLDPKRYNFEGLQAISAATTKVKANIIAMAYIIARARDPSGRLSDFDVQVAMESLGFDSNDKDIIAATISDRVREVVENSANFIEIATGKRPDLPALPAAPAPKTPKVFTIEELEALARGSN
ncbi:MAG: hypothetical protein IIA72_03925 [Proteobacteria bacterium]|nr:hypothetical protein [Pseudomonadota bacterium]